MRRKLWRPAQLLTLAVAAGATLTYASTAPAEPAAQHAANGFANIKTVDTAVCENTVGAASASKTQVLYDGYRVLGIVDTPALAKGQSVEVTAVWGASGVKGEHSLRATADQVGSIAEEAEANNTAHRLVTVSAGRVTNGAFAEN